MCAAFRYCHRNLVELWRKSYQMKDLDTLVFISLFREVYAKGFGHALEQPLSETESKLLSNRIQETTGLVIGVKSIKNYSVFVLDSADAKRENPSVATLDTLARFVLDAPYTDEVKRKDNQSHYPYWFLYKSKFPASATPLEKPTRSGKSRVVIVVPILVVAAVAVFFLFRSTGNNVPEKFSDTFDALHDDSLAARGWFVHSRDIDWWNRRSDNAGYLTLYTLRGDNWSDSVNTGRIKNLLLRTIPFDCFTAEVRMENFVPKRNWQQAGILLLEDTTLTGKGIRISLAYNDYFGGFSRPPEIIVQAISSLEHGGFSKPEEFAHVTVFTAEPESKSLITDNLKASALRIEKTESHYRFLFSNGPMENVAFREIAARDFDIRPKYIGLFAIEGFVDSEEYDPVYISFFSLASLTCEKK